MPSEATMPDVTAMELSMSGNVAPLLVDSFGRHTGCDVNGNQIFHDIPHSGCNTDTLCSSETGNCVANTFTIDASYLDTYGLASSTYQLILTGRQSGPYSLTVDVVSADQNPEPRINQTGTIAQGQQLRFLLGVSTASGSIPTIAAN